MLERPRLENLRKIADLIDSLLGSVFTGLGLFFWLWVLVLFPAAIIYWAWPWIVVGFEWLRELLTFV